jgi:hypothetical protein
MLAEATMELTGMAMDQNQNQFKGDENLRVQFSLFPQISQDKSTKEGRPIYDDVPYVTIIVPGQQDIVHRKAWSQDFQRFPKQWAAFQNAQNQDEASGTPLRVLPWMAASQVKELEFFNVKTVEQLANLADNVTARFMGGQGLKQRAKDFLEAAAKGAPLLQMRAELEKRDSQIEVMQRQLAELLKRAEAAEAAAAE